MNSNRAEQIIVISLFVLLSSTLGTNLVNKKKESEKEEESHFGKLLIGGFFTIFFASLLAEAAPVAGAGLAVSVASLAFFKDALPLIVEKSNTKTPATTTGTKPRVINV